MTLLFGQWSCLHFLPWLQPYIQPSYLIVFITCPDTIDNVAHQMYDQVDNIVIKRVAIDNIII